MIKAAAIILGPILCGGLFFLVQARGQKPGVYLETTSGIFEVPEYAVGTAPPFPVDPQRVAVPADATALSFFVVGPLSAGLAAQEQRATLYFFAVDRRDGTFQSEYLPIPINVRRINPLVYHITFDDIGAWQPDGRAGRHFREVLASTTRSRAGMELFAGLALPDPDRGSLRLYPVRFGP